MGAAHWVNPITKVLLVGMAVGGVLIHLLPQGATLAPANHFLVPMETAQLLATQETPVTQLHQEQILVILAQPVTQGVLVLLEVLEPRLLD